MDRAGKVLEIPVKQIEGVAVEVESESKVEAEGGETLEDAIPW